MFPWKATWWRYAELSKSQMIASNNGAGPLRTGPVWFMFGWCGYFAITEIVTALEVALR